MNVILWILQLLLAAMFSMAGYMKLTMPVDELATKLAWTKDVPLPLVRIIGFSELTGVLGLLLPSLLRIKPILTPFAATGLAIIMLLATVFHISRGEFHNIRMTITIGLIAGFIAWGRFEKTPIKTKPTHIKIR